MSKSTTSTFRSRVAAPKPKTNRFFTYCVIIFFVLLILQKTVGAFSINFFTIIDHLLNINDHVAPIFMWGVLGIFTGTIIGSLVVWKKYRLAFKWNYISFGALGLFILLLLMISSPMGIVSGLVYQQRDEAANLTEVSSESGLAAYKEYTYDAANLLDSVPGTAWIFVHEDQLGESVNFIFGGEKMLKVGSLNVNGIRIMNGFNKSHSKWNSFNRIRGFTVYKNGTKVYDGVAADLFNTDETIDFEPVEAKAGDTIKIHVNSIYRIKKTLDIAAVSKMVPMVTYRPD